MTLVSFSVIPPHGGLLCLLPRNLFCPTWFPEHADVLLYATRSMGALGYNPEVAVIAVGERSTIVSRRDALTGLETSREEVEGKVASVLPMGVKDGQERSVLMVVNR